MSGKCEQKWALTRTANDAINFAGDLRHLMMVLIVQHNNAITIYVVWKTSQLIQLFRIMSALPFPLSSTSFLFTCHFYFIFKASRFPTDNDEARLQMIAASLLPFLKQQSTVHYFPYFTINLNKQFARICSELSLERTRQQLGHRRVLSSNYCFIFCFHFLATIYLFILTNLFFCHVCAFSFFEASAKFIAIYKVTNYCTYFIYTLPARTLIC